MSERDLYIGKAKAKIDQWHPKIDRIKTINNVCDAFNTALSRFKLGRSSGPA